jgi:MFS family permease
MAQCHTGEVERSSAVASFTRDRFTCLAYLMLGYFAYLQASLGPLMPFLRTELHLSYTIGSLHPSAFAIGAIVTGLIGERIAHRWGRRGAFWGGGAGMAVGAALLALGNQVIVTLTSAFLMGAFGALLLIMIQATLADRHGERRATALMEANVVASAAAGLAPLLIGGFQHVGIGWRAALFTAIGALALLAQRFRRVPLPEPRVASEPRHAPKRPLPPAFWAYWGLLALSVAAEWCMIIWSADFLRATDGLNNVTAASVVSVFFVAELAGRIAGSYLSRVVRGETLLFIALASAIVGFPLFWLAPLAPLNIAGLFITGLGIANLYPLGVALAVGIAPQQADAASARTSLAGGVAVASAPLVLGWIADHAGIHSAYGIVIALLFLAVAMACLARRLALRRPEPQAVPAQSR